MRAIRLGLRMLMRQWRSGELGVLLLALTVAVGALGGVGLLVDRIERGLRAQATEVLGADLRLQSPQPLSADYAVAALQQGMRVSRITSMLSVVLYGDVTQLANLHAVADGYPLRGTVRVTDAPYGAPRDVRGIPAPGELWADSRLTVALGAQVGDLLSVGSAQLRITRILVSRPDQGTGFSELAPSLLMNDADLVATALLQPGSRASRAVLFGGNESQVAQFALWIAANKQPAERLRDLREASPEVANAATRATRFLLLASLASVLLGAVAVAMTARRYVQRHLDVVALLKTLGASRRFAFIFSLAQLLLIAALAIVLGSLMAWLAQAWLLQLLQPLLAVQLPSPALRPLLPGVAAAVLLLCGFALPPVLQLARVPAIRILRRDMDAPAAAMTLAYGPAVLAIVAMILQVTRDWALAGWFTLGLAGSVLLLAAAAWLLVRSVGRLRGGVGVAWRYGIANLARRRGSSVVQVIAFGLGLTALLLLAVIRGDLIESWRASLPASAPNFFFVNIPADKRDGFVQQLKTDGAEPSRLWPMVRGRLLAINEQPVQGRSFPTPRGDGFARREQNLSWSAQLGEGNRVIAGRWFDAADVGKPLVSVAVDFQEALGLKLGDQLRFDIAGETFDVTVASVREVKWDSLQPNFFLVFAPGLLDATAGTWMTSARYPPAQAAKISALVRAYPSVSVFDMQDLFDQLRAMIDKAVLAVQGVFLFTLLAGLTVLLAAVQSSRDERRYESAVLRTLGARSATILQGVLVEFGALGLVSGLLAASIATAGGWLVSSNLLDVPYRPDLRLWLGGVGGAVLLACLMGWSSTRRVIREPPLGVLRDP